MAGRPNPHHPGNWSELERQAEARGRYEERKRMAEVIKAVAADVKMGRHASTSMLGILRVLWRRMRL